jgi:hypothetical protein
MLPKNEIKGVISLPRLVFTDFMFSAIETLGPLNIQLDRGGGAFWSQVLTRTIEPILKDDKPKYILTLDYDTWFRKEHVLRLYQLMEENPEYDCLIPLQTKRAGTDAMFAINYDEESSEVPVDYFDGEVSDIQGGHFGLTIFRASAFERLEKPWFNGVPAPDGTWNDGRTDPDIYFWKNWRKTCKTGLANDVVIGHMQMICTFSGLANRGWKPVHVNTHDTLNENLPSWAIPRITDAYYKKLAGRINQSTTGVRKTKRRRSKVK